MPGATTVTRLEHEGGVEMTLTRKDAGATFLTALAVLAFLAAERSWDVWLIGSSNRWSALAITALGVGACVLGSAADEMSKEGGMSPATRILSIAGAVTGIVAIWAVVSGSSTALWLLIAGVVVLWAGSTLRHAWHPTHRPVTT
jgi:hypothetical protein